MALIAFAHAHGIAATVLCVDHGLRDAQTEQAGVAALAARYGFAFALLRAEGAPSGSLQAWARGARYAALAKAARARGIASVATAHTLDDAVETFLMRLGRGAGLRGLSAMRPVADVGGVRVVRPFLSVRRAALRAALRARGVAWFEDPSNADPRFDRARVRALLPALEAAGLPLTRINASAQHLSRASGAIESAVATLVAGARVDRAGAVHIARENLLAAPDEVRLRALSDLAARAGGRTPRFSAVVALDARLAGGGCHTLGGAVAEVGPVWLRLWREARGQTPLTLAPGARGTFDNRYAVANDGARVVTVAPVGDQPCPMVAFGPAIPQAPGVFVDGQLVAAPTLGVVRRGFGGHGVRVRPLVV